MDLINIINLHIKILKLEKGSSSVRESRCNMLPHHRPSKQPVLPKGEFSAPQSVSDTTLLAVDSPLRALFPPPAITKPLIESTNVVDPCATTSTLLSSHLGALTYALHSGEFQTFFSQ
ncbi:hypothetical protein PVK06_010843 [Gossypium arboreum]|uniref:Uncharacterized protein n=1 Tax=Gossypium arboreum TaxID=29729 RepID=A0ABR0Q7W9_GOSAR|nr:hypothetical protein PVK06_010843 [Gossypium arboreum]